MHVSGRVRAGIASVLLVFALLAGALAGKMTQHGAVRGAAATARQPVPVLLPVAAGPAPPSGRFVAGFLPPDPRAQAAAAQAAVKAHPDQFSGPPAPAATAVPAGTASRGGIGRIAGYADGSGFFRDTSAASTISAAPSGASSAETAGTSTGPRASSPASSSGPIAAGTLPQTAPSVPPNLVDVCASDSAPPGCQGVPGTIRPIDLRLFRFTHDPQAVSGWPAECAGPALGSGQFIFELRTTNLGSFTVRYRAAGSGAAFTELTGDSPATWRSALDADPATTVVTCIPARRPAPGDQRLEVDVTGTGADGSGTDQFTGTISLPAAGSSAAGQRRDGRPPVTVQAVTSATLQVDVPVGQRETAKVSLVTRASAGAGEPCLNPSPGTVTSAQPYQPASVRRVGQTSSLAWTDSDFRVSAPQAGWYAVCVSWLDDGVPPRTIERAGIPVRITSAAAGEVLLAGYETAAGAPRQPRSIDVSISTDGGATCLAPTITADQYAAATDRTHAVTVCRFDGAPGYLGARIYAHFGDSQPLVIRALLSLSGDCPAAAGCTQWWTPIVHGPDHAADGAVVLGIHVPGPSGDVTIGAEHPVRTGQATVRGPRLLADGVSVTVSPDDPRTVVATWASDQPARVLATAAAGDYPGCPEKTSARSVRAATTGTITISGLCPGVRYEIGFDLFNSSQDRTIYTLSPPGLAGGGTDIVYRAWPVTTRPLPVRLDYQLSFQLTDNGRPLTIGVVPEELSLQFPTGAAGNGTRGYRFAQDYTGRPWIGMSCAQAHHYDRSGTGLALDLSGGELSLTDSEFAFSLYWPSRRGVFDTGRGPRCPSLYNQVNHTPARTGTSWDCDFVISRLAPAGDSNSLYSLLSGVPATFTSAYSCPANPSIRMTVSLTVRQE